MVGILALCSNLVNCRLCVGLGLGVSVLHSLLKVCLGIFTSTWMFCNWLVLASYTNFRMVMKGQLTLYIMRQV